MKWFRFYSEVVNDPKVQLLSDDLFKLWVNLLCVASANNGKIPPAGDVAFQIRVSEEQAERGIEALVKRGLLHHDDDGGYSPHNWGERQYNSDVSTARVNRYRERTRANGSVVGSYLKHRDEVFQRDGNACVYCGSDDNLCLDHMIPVAKGGTDEPDNLCVACKRCNSGKAGRTPDEAGLTFRNKVTEQAYRTSLSRFQQPPATVAATSSDTDTDTEADTDTPTRGGPHTTVTQGNERVAEVTDRKGMKVIAVDTELDSAMIRAAQNIHSRHPLPRRDIGVKQIVDKLRIIAKRYPRLERVEAICNVDRNHAAWCKTHGWTKEGGEYAKGLGNWLAPTMERYAEPPPEASATQERDPYIPYSEWARMQAEREAAGGK